MAFLARRVAWMICWPDLDFGFWMACRADLLLLRVVALLVREPADFQRWRATLLMNLMAYRIPGFTQCPL